MNDMNTLPKSTIITVLIKVCEVTNDRNKGFNKHYFVDEMLSNDNVASNQSPFYTSHPKTNWKSEHSYIW